MLEEEHDEWVGLRPEVEAALKKVKLEVKEVRVTLKPSAATAFACGLAVAMGIALALVLLLS